jgi:hypothetical protein
MNRLPITRLIAKAGLFASLVLIDDGSTDGTGRCMPLLDGLIV